MKPREALILIVVLCIGVLLGRVSSPSGTSSRDADDGAEGGPSRTRVSERDSTPQPNTPFARLRKEIRTAPPEQCGNLLRKALDTPDPLERQSLLGEILARMDASNCYEMSLVTPLLTRETGRSLPDEWMLIHARVGQVAGAEAMARWGKQGNLGGHAAERTLWGWATQDPDSARQWLDANPDLPQPVRDKLASTIMDGAIIKDPQRAISLLESLPDAERAKKTDPFVGAFVQYLGKDRAIEWLATLPASETESAYGKSLTRSVFDKTMWAGAGQTNAKVMAADLERLASIMPIDEVWINRGMGQIRDRKAIGGIELLDQIARSPTLSRIPLGELAWSGAVGHALQRDRAAVAKWLSENTDSPIHSMVSSMADGGG